MWLGRFALALPTGWVYRDSDHIPVAGRVVRDGVLLVVATASLVQSSAATIEKEFLMSAVILESTLTSPFAATPRLRSCQGMRVSGSTNVSSVTLCSNQCRVTVVFLLFLRHGSMPANSGTRQKQRQLLWQLGQNHYGQPHKPAASAAFLTTCLMGCLVIPIDTSLYKYSVIGYFWTVPITSVRRLVLLGVMARRHNALREQVIPPQCQQVRYWRVDTKAVIRRSWRRCCY